MNAQRLIALATLVIAGAFAMNDIRVGVFPADLADGPGTYWVYSCGLNRGRGLARMNKPNTSQDHQRGQQEIHQPVCHSWQKRQQLPGSLKR